MIVNKLIDSKNKDENKLIIDNLLKNKEFSTIKDEIDGWLVKPESKRVNLIAASDLLINFNKEILKKIN